MNNMSVYKAQSFIGKDLTASLCVTIEEEVPVHKEPAAYEKLYEADAKALADALYNTLPGGTFDRLLRNLFAYRTTKFAVSWKGLEKTT